MVPTTKVSIAALLYRVLLKTSRTVFSNHFFHDKRVWFVSFFLGRSVDRVWQIEGCICRSNEGESGAECRANPARGRKAEPKFRCWYLPKVLEKLWGETRKKGQLQVIKSYMDMKQRVYYLKYCLNRKIYHSFPWFFASSRGGGRVKWRIHQSTGTNTFLHDVTIQSFEYNNFWNFHFIWLLSVNYFWSRMILSKVVTKLCMQVVLSRRHNLFAPSWTYFFFFFQCFSV